MGGMAAGAGVGLLGGMLLSNAMQPDTVIVNNYGDTYGGDDFGGGDFGGGDFGGDF
jgi:hypothetical protein